MALFLNDQEVAQLLPMGECIDVLDQAFAHAGEGKVDNRPRNRIRMPGGFFRWRPRSGSGPGGPPPYRTAVLRSHSRRA